MKHTKAILVGCLAISLAGCALRGAPKTAKATPPAPKLVVAAPPPAPPQPLSIPQTNVELPKSQPVDPEALLTLPLPPEPAPEPVTPRRPRRAAPVTTSPPAPKAEATQTQPEPEQRPAIQEIIPEAERNRLHDSVVRRKAEIEQILNQANNRRQTTLQKGVVRTIRSFMDLADDAEKHGDVRQADALAERAQILAKELQGGK